MSDSPSTQAITGTHGEDGKEPNLSSSPVPIRQQQSLPGIQRGSKLDARRNAKAGHQASKERPTAASGEFHRGLMRTSEEKQAKLEARKAKQQGLEEVGTYQQAKTAAENNAVSADSTKGCPSVMIPLRGLAKNREQKLSQDTDLPMHDAHGR